ncbi:MAG: hypothetical protein BMS9Abin29_0684 [Gemmatimonadota bacterium]|nr:MAG: hypothetical protein BMS9Abin29_0684 [Gemmatimonadota bacterium]
MIEQLQGSAPSLGDFRVALARGLTALACRDGHSRNRIFDALERSLAPASDPLARVACGRGVDESADGLERAVRMLARRIGLAEVERQLKLIDDEVAAQGGRELEATPGELSGTLEQKEQTLREVRADAAEVNGDMEVANMDWLRERQDAETHLMAYRDRARELKVRLQEMESGGAEAPCPTCGKVLADHHARVITQLHEEWESIVQDGSWWKRRREQLELKPPALQGLENESVRLQARIEAYSKEVERLRALSTLGHAEEPTKPAQASEPDQRTGAAAEIAVRAAALRALRVELIEKARDLLVARAGRNLNRLMSGAILGVVQDVDGQPIAVRDEGPTPFQSDEEVAAYVLALRVALADLVAERSKGFPTLMIGDPFDRLGGEAKVRLVGLLHSLLPRFEQVFLLCPGEIVDLVPERFDRALEFQEGADGASAVRVIPGGVGRLTLH